MTSADERRARLLADQIGLPYLWDELTDDMRERFLAKARVIRQSDEAAGMVLVPREATAEIVHAIASQLDHPNAFMGGPSPGAKIRAERVYSAMIAAVTEADNG